MVKIQSNNGGRNGPIEIYEISLKEAHCPIKIIACMIIVFVIGFSIFIPKTIIQFGVEISPTSYNVTVLHHTW